MADTGSLGSLIAAGAQERLEALRAKEAAQQSPEAPVTPKLPSQAKEPEETGARGEAEAPSYAMGQQLAALTEQLGTLNSGIQELLRKQEEKTAVITAADSPVDSDSPEEEPTRLELLVEKLHRSTPLVQTGVAVVAAILVGLLTYLLARIVVGGVEVVSQQVFEPQIPHDDFRAMWTVVEFVIAVWISIKAGMLIHSLLTSSESEEEDG